MPSGGVTMKEAKATPPAAGTWPRPGLGSSCRVGTLDRSLISAHGHERRAAHCGQSVPVYRCLAASTDRTFVLGAARSSKHSLLCGTKRKFAAAQNTPESDGLFCCGGPHEQYRYSERKAAIMGPTVSGVSQNMLCPYPSKVSWRAFGRICLTSSWEASPNNPSSSPQRMSVGASIRSA